MSFEVEAAGGAGNLTQPTKRYRVEYRPTKLEKVTYRAEHQPTKLEKVTYKVKSGVAAE